MKPNPDEISRKPLAIWISICLVLAAVSIPLALRLPKVIEAEIVMGGWWLVWAITLSVLLYRGRPVADDADWIGKGTHRFQGWLDMLGTPFETGCLFDEGCATLLLAIIAFLLLGLAFILLIEFVVPAIAILLFLSIGGMLARAVNDNHHCQRNLALSVLWGALWATVYVGPVAAIVIWTAGLIK